MIHGAASASLTARGQSEFTVADEVYVDDTLFARAHDLNDNLFCHTHEGTSKFKVCGCGVKVVAHMMSECQTYDHYDEQIGTCDCAVSGCDEKTLTSGYTEKFPWKASSFMISAC